MRSPLSKKQILLGAAISGLLMISAQAGQKENSAKKAKTPPAAEKEGECHGINSCKGKGDCGGPGYSCAGNNECKGKGWLKMTQSACEEKGGKFVPDEG